MVVAKASAELTYPSHVPALAASTTSASGCVLALFSSSCDGPDALPLLQAPPEYGEEVGNIEGESVLVLVVLPLSRLVLTLAPSLAGEMVAWCTKEGYGTRIIPEGALQGVQFTRVRPPASSSSPCSSADAASLARRRPTTSRSSASSTRPRSTCSRRTTAARWCVDRSLGPEEALLFLGLF